MTRSLRLLAAASLCAIAACGGSNVTYLDATVTIQEGLQVDQLQFDLLQGTSSVMPTAARPQNPGAVLSGDQTITILLPDSLAGQSLTLRVTGFYQGVKVTTGHADNIILAKGKGSNVVVRVGHFLLSLDADPTSLNLALGQISKIQATAVFSDDITDDVADQSDWTSSNPSVATVSSTSPKGLVTAVAQGSTTITFTYPGNDPITVPVTVGPRAITSFAVAPASATFAMGTTGNLTATAQYSDGTNDNVTTSATWSSSNNGIATVDSTGLVTPVSPGLITVTATYQGQTATASISIVTPQLVSISVEPANGKIAVGFTQQYLAFGVYSDQSSRNITSSVSWSTSPPGVAHLSQTVGHEGLLTGDAVGTTDVIALLNDVTGQTSLQVTDATLTSISISPAGQTVASGTKVTFTATGVYSDSTTSDITNLVTWGSSNNSVATIQDTVNFPSRFTTLSQGDVTITAQPPANASSVTPGSTVLHVTPATLSSIEVDPQTPTIAKGRQQQFTATARFSDSTTQDVTATTLWSTNNSNVLPINSSGVATAANTGGAIITGLYQGHTAQTTVTVSSAVITSIAISPVNPTASAGTSKQLKATATFSDNSTSDVTTSATWTTSDPTIATVGTNTGNVGAVAKGSATITANASGIPGSVLFQVTDATLVSIAITPPNPSLPKGSSTQLTATGTYTDNSTQDITNQVAWSTGDSTIVAVSNAVGPPSTKGQITATAGSGSTTITASLTFGSGPTTVTGSTTAFATSAVPVRVDCSPTPLTLAVGQQQQLTATVTLSDGTTRTDFAVSWTSSKPLIATVSASGGLAKAVAQGTATLTATAGTATANGCALTVSPAQLISIAIDQGNTSLVEGSTENLTATGTYTDGTRDVTALATWSVIDTTVATISNNSGSQGLVTAATAKTGTTNVTATLGAVSNPTTTITVTAPTLLSFAITPSSGSVPNGQSFRFRAQGTYSSGPQQFISSQVLWSVDPPTSGPVIAVVSNVSGNAGMTTGQAVGTATVRAHYNACTGTCAPTCDPACTGIADQTATITVTAAVFTGVTVTSDQGGPPTIHTTGTTTTQLTATATYSDSSTVNVSSTATWGTTNSAVATVSSSGLVTAVGVGTATISAQYTDGVTNSGSILVTVN